MNAHEQLGTFVAAHYRRAALLPAHGDKSGVRRTAERLKKQGWPIGITLLALLGIAAREDSSPTTPPQ